MATTTTTTTIGYEVSGWHKSAEDDRYEDGCQLDTYAPAAWRRARCNCLARFVRKQP